MNSGSLVPDEITISMLKEELDKNPQAKGFLFDGFPRTVAQAEALDHFMKANHSAIHHVVALEVTEQEVRARIAKRKLVDNRVDDEEDKLNKRIDEYFNKTVHVLPYYNSQGRLNSVNGIGAVDDIFQSICKIIDKK
jgi:adenylate kinase